MLLYNKQDEPLAMPREALDPLFNVERAPALLGTATTGDGVAQALRALISLVAERLADPARTVTQPGPAFITCCRCETRLEVPTAAVGTAYTCGACQTAIEITDPVRGTTRPVALQRPKRNPEDGFASGEIPQDDGEALTRRAGRTPEPSSSTFRRAGLLAASTSTQQLPIPLGYEILAVLDDSPLGLRVRTRNQSTGAIQRMLLVSQAATAVPSFAQALDARVRTTGAIRHPHLLPLVQYIPAEAALISADAPEHEPLSHLLARRRTIAPPHAMDILRQLALALEEAARRGVVHGWIRPEAVLISASGQALLDDLCAAKPIGFLLNQPTSPSEATEHWLAPECVDGGEPDLRSDIFAIGALLHRMITGTGLMTGASCRQALLRYRTGGPPSLRRGVQGVSPELDAFFQRLVAANPGERISSWGEVVQGIDRFGGGAQRQAAKFTAAVYKGHVPRSANSSTVARRRRGGTQPLPPVTDVPFSSSGAAISARLPPPAPAPMRRSSGGSGIFTGIILGVAAVAVAVCVWVVVHHQNSFVTIPVTSPEVPPEVATPTTAGLPPASSIPAEKPLTTLQRLDILKEIDGMILAERFQAAKDQVVRLPAADRSDRLARIQTTHDLRMHEVTAAVAAARTQGEAESVLRAPLLTWGLPGDKAWAEGLLAAAQQRLGSLATIPAVIASVPVVPVVAAPPTAVTAPASAPTQAAVVIPVNPWRSFDKLDPVLDRALIAGGEIPAITIDEPVLARALATKVAGWRQREAVLNQAVAAKIRLRLVHPTTQQTCDVTQATAKSIELKAANGAASTLNWNAIPPADLARICGEAAQAPGLSGELLGAAAAAQLVAGDTVQATLTLKRGKTIPAELRSDLELLVAAHARRARTAKMDAVEIGIQLGSMGPLDEAAALLTDPAGASIPGTAEDRVWLDAVRASMTAAAPKRSASASRDRTQFDQPGDINDFSRVSGAWSVADGAATADAEASLIRDDVNDGSSVAVTFRPILARGALTVEFRGARVVLDLSANRLTMLAQGRENPPQAATAPPQVASTLVLEYRAATSSVVANLNGGMVSGEISLANAPTSRLAITLDSGARMAIDEVALTRDQALTGDKATLKLLGWEAQGQVTLEGAAIALTALPDGTRGGIASRLRSQVIGYTFEAKGSGGVVLRFGRGREQADTWDEFIVPLPGDVTKAARYVVTWGDGVYLVKDGEGAVLLREPCPMAPSDLAILATEALTLLATPRPTLR